LVVDRKGKGRLRPQSPRVNDVCGVVIERLMGYGSVAESELKLLLDERLGKGRGRVGGIANSLEARRSAPPGDVLLDAIDVDYISPPRCLMGSGLRNGNASNHKS
jgi:hypothetical protein